MGYSGIFANILKHGDSIVGVWHSCVSEDTGLHHVCNIFSNGSAKPKQATEKDMKTMWQNVTHCRVWQETGRKAPEWFPQHIPTCTLGHFHFKMLGEKKNPLQK